MRVAQSLIPTRFLVMTAHLILVIMIFYSKHENVNAGLAIKHTDAQFDDASRTLNWALWLSIICFVIEYIGFCSGMSMFRHGLSFFSILAHFGGAVAASFFIVESWHYLAFWYIFAFCSALTALLELGVIASILICKIQPY